MKRLSDFPQFTVVRKVPEQEPLKIFGTFDRVDGVTDGLCTLYSPEALEISVEGLLKDLDVRSRTAWFEIPQEHSIFRNHKTFRWLPPRFQSVLIQQILEDTEWERVDTASWVVVRTDTPDGRWTLGRYHGGPLQPGQSIVKDSGYHHHCEICGAEVGPNSTKRIAYEERTYNQEICADCYERYAKLHDLSFFDEDFSD
jgi:hypothetical protein